MTYCQKDNQKNDTLEKLIQQIVKYYYKIINLQLIKERHLPAVPKHLFLFQEDTIDRQVH